MCEAICQRLVSRHAVEIPCEVITSEQDTPQLMWATDMSGGGLWLETEELLPVGEHIVVCFAPGIWWRAAEIQAFAEVVRLSPGLRLGDRGPGMAVRLLDVTPGERWALRRWLRPRPMPAPVRRLPGKRQPFQTVASPFAARLG